MCLFSDEIAGASKDYPHIDFDLHQDNYTSMKKRIMEGVLDCAFTVLPVQCEAEVIPLGRDPMYVVVPPQHSLAQLDKIPLRELEQYPFLLSQVGRDSEVLDILEAHQINLDVHFTTWDDYAIMAMVEKGLGISMLSGMILRRQNFHILIKELEVPAYRDIGLILREQKTSSLAVKRFIQYLHFREEARSH